MNSNETPEQSAEAPEATATEEVIESTTDQEKEQVASEAERVEDKIRKEPQTKADAMFDVAEVLFDTKLDKDQRKTLVDAKQGIEKIMSQAESAESNELPSIIEHLLQERYHMTIQDFLGAFKPTKLEYLSPPMALSAEMTIRIASSVLEIEPADLSLMKKAEYRWKVGGDVLKIFAMIAKFFPAVAAASIPAGVAGTALNRMGEALERVNASEDSTAFDVARETTLAALPRDESGKIDLEATDEMLKEVGRKIQAEESEDVDSREYFKQIGLLLENNPEKIRTSLAELNKTYEELRERETIEGAPEKMAA